MTNIEKGTDCTKENARFLISLTDKEPLINLLREFYGLRFKGSDCIENPSIKIQQNRKGEYWVKDFGSNSLGISNKNAQWIFNKHKAEAQEYYHFEQGAEQGAPPTKKAIDLQTYDIQQNAVLLDWLSAKTGANLDVLRAHHLNGCASAYGRKKAAAFCWNVNGYVKIRDTKSVRFKHLASAEKAKGNYIFALDQAQGKKLFLVGGETDALCINTFGGSEFSACCLLSESTILTQDIQNEILSKYAAQDVYILYDNDKTGIDKSADAAHVSSFNLIDAAKLYSMYGGKNDICEVYSAHGGGGVLDLLRTAHRLTSTQKKDIQDVFSFDVKNTTFCEFEQYLTEPKPLSLLKYAIETDKRILVQSSAGTGKSYACNDFAKIAAAHGLDRVIIITPTMSITEQLGKTLIALNEIEVGCIFGNLNKEQLNEQLQNEVIVCTTNKIENRLSHYINNLDLNKCLIIIDEAHQLISDYGYRQEACAAVFDLMQKAKYCVLLSATPNYFMCSNLAPFFNFRLYKFIPRVTNEIYMQIILHGCAKSEVLSRINEFLPSTLLGSHGIKQDNNRSLRAYKNKFGTERTLHYTSQKDNSEDVFYNEVMKNGGAGLDISKLPDTLLYTSIFEAGVSLAFAIPYISILDAKDARKIIQHSTRPRLQKDGTNSVINVNLYYSDKEPKKVLFKDIAKEFKRIENKAKKAAHYNQKYQIGEAESLHTHVDSVDFTKQIGAHYFVDYQAILYHLTQLEAAAATPELIERRIKRLDSRFIFKEVIHINKEQDELKEIISAEKASAKEAQASAKELLKNSPYSFLAAAAHISKDADFKVKIMRLLNIVTIDKETAKEYISTAAQAFCGKYAQAAAAQICAVCERGKTLAQAVDLVTSATIKEAKNKVANLTNKKRLNTLIRVAHGKETLLNGKDTNEAKHFSMCRKKLQKIIYNIRFKNRSNLLTAKEIQKIVNLCINSTLRAPNEKTTNLNISQNKTAAQAVDYVRAIYKLEAKIVKIDNKRTTFYILGNKI